MPLILTPTPQRIIPTGSIFSLTSGLLAVNAPTAGELFSSARQLQDAVETFAGVHLDIVAGKPAPQQARITLNIAAHASQHPQGYELSIDGGGVHIVASAPAGVFYGVQTLRQILLQSGAELPGLRITDWPDFPNRGVLLDISRDRVPTMETLYALIDLLASLKINQFQLYT
ncbi:MAG TPA: glycoside hydrolase, partial [Caldilineae bacterium]|nr:glycoside hydrolase [Caldilineae bacterium]